MQQTLIGGAAETHSDAAVAYSSFRSASPAASMLLCCSHCRTCRTPSSCGAGTQRAWLRGSRLLPVDVIRKVGVLELGAGNGVGGGEARRRRRMKCGGHRNWGRSSSSSIPRHWGYLCRGAQGVGGCEDAPTAGTAPGRGAHNEACVLRLSPVLPRRMSKPAAASAAASPPPPADTRCTAQSRGR